MLLGQDHRAHVPALEQGERIPWRVLGGPGGNSGGRRFWGNDAVNDLTWLFLDVMELSGLRDHNYMARISEVSPEPYVKRAVEVASRNAVPGLFNGKATIAALGAAGHHPGGGPRLRGGGCVEPTMPAGVSAPPTRPCSTCPCASSGPEPGAGDPAGDSG